MRVGILKIDVQIPWVRSLKEKRSVSKSLISKSTQRFSISIAEVDHQDVHELIGLGVAVVARNAAQVDSILDKTLNYLQNNTEGEVIVTYREVL